MLTAPGGLPRLASVSVGPAGEAVALWTDESGRDALFERTTNAGGASFASTTTEAPVLAAVSVETAEWRASYPIVGQRDGYPMVQPLPDDEFLVVAGRCPWRPLHEGPEQNATVFGPDGAARRTGCLGDGIAEVFTTRSGAIWAGYFDEGVFGNLGWGGARGSSRPIGERGIVRFDPASLAVAWQLPPSSIADCYALNVYGEEAWSCYYTDFPIARVADGRLTEWPNDVTGADVLLVDGNRAALIGGYGEDGGRIVVGHLEDGRFVVDETTRLTAPDGDPPRGRMVGRGPDLHVFDDTRWLRLSLDDL